MTIRWMQFLVLLLVIVIERSETRDAPPNVSGVSMLDSNTEHLPNSEENLKSFKDLESEKSYSLPHSRKKRLVWITDDGRLALPPGTTLSITPTIAMPLVRYPLEGFLSNVTISLPLTIDFDKLGLTDNQNPLGVLPPIFDSSFGKSIGSMLGNYVASYMHYRRKRSLIQEQEERYSKRNFKVKIQPEVEEPVLPDQHRHVFHGGERALLYGVVEDFISTFGMNGKGCLLRTICEVHSKSIDHFGVFGEIVKLFLTATKSPFAKHIPEYVRAQEIGEGKQGPGECFPYYKECPKSLFKATETNIYSNPLNEDHEPITNDMDNHYSDIGLASM